MIYTIARDAGYAVGFCVVAYILFLLVVGVAHMAKLFHLGLLSPLEVHDARALPEVSQPSSES